MASLEKQAKNLLEEGIIQEKIASSKAVKKELGKMLSVMGKMNDKVSTEFDDYMDNKSLQKLLRAIEDVEDVMLQVGHNIK